MAKQAIEGITKEDFQAYEDIRKSGVTNMYAVKTVSCLTGLDRDTIISIMENYSELMVKYPSVRK